MKVYYYYIAIFDSYYYNKNIITDSKNHLRIIVIKTETKIVTETQVLDACKNIVTIMIYDSDNVYFSDKIDCAIFTVVLQH